MTSDRKRFVRMLIPILLAVSAPTVTHATSLCAHALTSAKDLNGAIRAIRCDTEGRHLVLVGDDHGSNEIPALVADLVAAYSKDAPVRLGVEIEPFEQAHIQAYVASAGTEADKDQLFHDNFWTAGQGRTSRAMVALIESVRRLRAQGRNVGIFTMVPPYPGDDVIEKNGGLSAYWNQGLARAVVTKLGELHGHGIVVAFMGSAHATIQLGAGKDAQTTANLLAQYSPYIIHLDVHGQTWSCGSTGCGVSRAQSAPIAHGSAGIIEKREQDKGQLIQLWLRMPKLTPSPPAKTLAHK